MAREPLYALTIHQPWASAIMSERGPDFPEGPKRVENRTWIPKLWRGWDPEQHDLRPKWVAIHAGKTFDAEAVQAVRDAELWPAASALAGDYPQGALLGVARFVGAVELAGDRYMQDNRWASGPWCWIIDTVAPLPKPRPCRGAQKLWRVPAEHVGPLREAVRARLARDRASG